jgi:hypothetical protein
MSRNPSLYTVLEGFLLKETGAKTTIDEDVVGVGGNSMQANRSRHLQAVLRNRAILPRFRFRFRVPNFLSTVLVLVPVPVPTLKF